jgi:Flp pilus assembly protein TadG
MKEFKGLRRQAGRFADDKRGSMTTMFALSLGAMIMGLGAALDVARVVTARQVLQQSVDSAAVAAVQSAMKGDTFNSADVSEATVLSFVRANMEAAGNTAAPALKMTPEITVTLLGDGIVVYAESSIPAGLTRMMGFGSLTVSAASEVAVNRDAGSAGLVRIAG